MAPEKPSPNSRAAWRPAGSWGSVQGLARSAVGWVTPESVVIVLAAVHLVSEALGVSSALSPIAWVVPLLGLGWVVGALLFPARSVGGDRVSRIARIAGSILLSIALTSAAFTGLALVWNLRAWTVAVVVDGSTIAVGLAAIRRPSRRGFSGRWPRFEERSVPAILIAGATLVLFAVWRWTTAYPVVNGWDMMTSLVSINFMQAHGGFAYLLIPPVPASAGIPYPGIYLELLAGLSLYLGLPPLAVFWWAPLFLLSAFAGLVYLLVLHFSARRWVAALVALLGIVLSAAQGEAVRSPLYLSVDMVAQVIFLLLVTWYVHTRSTPARRGWAVALGAAFLAVFYFYALVATLPFLAAMVVGPRRIPVVRSALRLFIVLEGALFAGLVALSVAPSGVSGALSQFADPSILPTSSKLGLLLGIYSPGTWLPIAAAVIMFFLNRRKVGEEPLGLRFFGVGALFLLLDILVPLWVTYRLEFYMRSMVLVFLASIALGPFPWPFRLAPRGGVAEPERFARNAETRRYRVALVVCLLLPSAALLPVFVDYSHGYNAFYSIDEYDAALWIRSNLPADAYLATDLGTGYFFRGLADRNASVYFILSDGRAPWDSSTLYPNLNGRLHSAFTRASPGTAARDFENLGIHDLYVLLSSRTPGWVNGDGLEAVAHPESSSDVSALAAFFAPPFFHLAFHAGDVYVFSVGP